MKKTVSVWALSMICVLRISAQDLYTFSNAEGQIIQDRIVKFDYLEDIVTLEENGKFPLDTFSETDQKYILHWNQTQGFKSTMRFKMSLEKDNWGRMKHEQTITPYFMDAIQIPGKKMPVHHVIFAEDYEEYNAVYLEAEGYTLTIRNQNLFPIENLLVESKIFYEQEEYIITDSLFSSSDDEYYDTVVTNKVRHLSESLPIIIPQETIELNSESAILIDHQVERSALASTTTGEDGDDSADESIDGFGEWDDHGRRRKGKVLGCWFRIGIVGTDGEMVWREITEPTSLPDKFTWDGNLVED